MSAVAPGDPSPTDTDTDRAWLEAAIDLAAENVVEGGGPFGAVIVRGGELVARGQNRVTRDNDPTAHAEVVAIRAACARDGSFSLAGATLYTSCEPCPLCVAAALWSRLDRVVYAADRHDAARGGFDDRAFYELFEQDPATWPTVVTSLALERRTAPFDLWLAFDDRIAY